MIISVPEASKNGERWKEIATLGMDFEGKRWREIKFSIPATWASKLRFDFSKPQGNIQQLGQILFYKRKGRKDDYEEEY